ncbi:MAG TPA: membrane protein insertase YidC [Thermoanaerobaculia bacterium]|jgi:YidC/Oxa1 family membrane protein insertase|nr:membrane protein insertase YidC [Thermoanaerobaculia bacterium]
MEKRLLIAAFLSLGILLLWEWVGPKSPRRAPATAPIVPTRGAAILPTAVAPVPTPAASAERIAGASEGLTTLENSVARATFSNRGAVLTSFVLLKHFDDQRRPLELVRAIADPAKKPLALLFDGNSELTSAATNALYAVEPVGAASGRALSFRYTDERVSVTKEIRFGDGYLFDVKVSVAGPEYTVLAGTGLRNPTAQELESRYVMPSTAVATAGRGLEVIPAQKLKGEQTLPLPPNGFVGIEDNYFIAVLAPRQAATARIFPVTVASAANAGAAPPAGSKGDILVSAGVSASGSLDLRAFFGPKDVEILEKTGLGLERTVDFGWYGILARPLLWLLKKAYSWTGNYGVAILLVTLLIRILLFPLMHKSYASMKKMQKLAPKMNAIRDKYKKAKTDAAQRQKMNQELMALYQAEGYNPMSGCFPVLLQLPILVAFYNVLSRAVELRHAPFMLWIKDLSAVDHSYVLVILMIVTMYIQQAMTPSMVDPVQKKIFMAMPLLWGFMLKNMPAGLVLYWLFSNVLTILQQMLINRMGRDESDGKGKPARLKPARA